MKRYTIFLLAVIVITGGVVGCGPSEEEQQRAEQARQDSLEEVRQQRLEEQRQDSIARADSIKAAKKTQEAEEQKEERMDVAFDEDGNYAVQVEAWRSHSKAEEQIEKWQNRGFENAFVVQHGSEETGDVWFRVRLGRLSTQEAAQNIQAQIKENYGADSWISTATQ